MHKKLEHYLNNLHQENLVLKFPKFCSKFSKDIDNKTILAIHQDPGNSSPENKTGECSIENPDPTAEKLKEVIRGENIDPNNVLLWNFFSFFGYTKNSLSEDDIDYWAKKIDELVHILPNIKVLIVSGNDAWLGMRYFRTDKSIQIISSPHPSRRGVNSSKSAPNRLKSAWKLAKKKIDESNTLNTKDNELIVLKNNYEEIVKRITEVTGRDNQIIIESLSISIPIMLKYSLDASNVSDTMKIVEARGGELPLKNMSRNLAKFIFQIIEDLKNGKTYASEKKSAYIEKEIRRYLVNHLNEDLPL